ncbi:MAG: DEAD/DEAH box helicase [Rhabdochlamydiaceae bacterium]
MALYFNFLVEPTPKGDLLILQPFCLDQHKRKFSYPVLYALANSDQKSLIDLLVKEELAFANLLAYHKDTISLDRIRIRPQQVGFFLKKLCAAKMLFFKEKPLLFNPFLTLDLIWLADYQLSGLSLSLNFADKNQDKKVSFIFSGEPIWVIVENTVYFLSSHVDWRWLKLFSADKLDVILSKSQEERFVEEFKHPAADGPLIIWGEPLTHHAYQSPQPILRLTDSRGAFANLEMMYANNVHFCFEETLNLSQRSLEDEKEWEKELIKVGFIKKNIEKSRYYCPLDAVLKAVNLLLESGWMIYDNKGRQVVNKANWNFTIEEGKDGYFMKGDLSFSGEQKTISSLMTAVSNQEHFLPLGEKYTGLIPHSLTQALQDLTSCSFIGDAVFLKKHERGLVDPLIEDGWVLKRSPSLELDLHQKEVQIPSCFLGRLYPYQQEGVNWLYFLFSGQLGGILADEMGLGKTVQVIAFLSLYQQDSPCILIVPSSLVFNWQKELAKFLPSLSLYLHTGPQRSKDKDFLKKQNCILTTYTHVRLDIELFSQISFGAIILDEAQYIKNAQSQTATAIHRLKSHFRLAITGTPMENKSDDLWSLFKFLIPDLFPQLSEFKGQSPSLIKKKISPFLLKRKKEEVASDLPQKIEQVVLVQMNEEQKQLYEAVIAKAKLNKNNSSMQILELLLRLRQICCHPLLLGEEGLKSAKLEAVLCDLEEVLAQKRKVLVFSQFTQFLTILKKEIISRNWSYCYLDGETKNRQNVVEQFQEHEGEMVFLMSLKAGGVGLNLTAADYVFLLDPWWNEAIENQAIDRAHRIGRKHTVIAKRYVTYDSIEEKIMEMKKYKKDLIDQFCDFELNSDSISLKELYDFLI